MIIKVLKITQKAIRVSQYGTHVRTVLYLGVVKNGIRLWEKGTQIRFTQFESKPIEWAVGKVIVATLTCSFITICHIKCGVIQRFPALRKAVTTHVKKISYFFMCVDVANQLLTRHSPLAPLGQVDEWTAKPSRFSIQVVCRSFLELWRLKH